MSLTPSMGKTFDRYIKEGWHAQDERYRGVESFLKRGVGTDNDCMSVDARKKSPFYQEFLAADNLTDYAGVRVGRGDNVWNLSLQRSPREGPYSKDELRSLARLSQMLDSIVKVSSALGFAKGEAVLDAFQFSETCGFLLNRKGEVVRVNPAAEELLGVDLQITNKRVRLRNAHETELLDRSIRALFWEADAPVVPPVVLSKESGGKLVVYPMRLPGLADSPLSAFHVILVVSDTDAQRSHSAATLRTVFNLTAAEARLATAMGNGRDVEAYAGSVGVSKETVRNQLKSIFLKTNTGRQAELVALLATLMPNR